MTNSLQPGEWPISASQRSGLAAQETKQKDNNRQQMERNYQFWLRKDTNTVTTSQRTILIDTQTRFVVNSSAD